MKGKIIVSDVMTVPSEKRWRKMLLFALLSMLLLGVFGMLTYQSQQQNQSTACGISVEHSARSVQKTGMGIKGTPHTVIHITGDSGFIPANGVTGGSGTQTDPYIIENWDIDGNGGTYCIWIENTDVWFVIRNCKLWNTTFDWDKPYATGIYLKNVQHGTLVNNTCSGNSFAGIYIESSSNNTIVNNNCCDNSQDGIYLESATNNNIMNNNCLSNIQNGIYLKSSSNNNITNNSCLGSLQYGIHIEESGSNNITNNNCSSNYYGIYLKSSSNNNLTSNICSANSWTGLTLDYYSSNNNIMNNTCSSNKGSGVELISVSSNNNLTHNNCSGNSGSGIYVSLSWNNTIMHNNFYHNTYYAINITSYSTGNIIHHNNFWQNNGAGKGVNGNCQAYDDAGGNYWYDNASKEGNYWSNWDGNGWGTPSGYPIDGGAGAYDPYPLNTPVTPELSLFPMFAHMFALLGIVLHRVKLRSYRHRESGETIRD